MEGRTEGSGGRTDQPGFSTRAIHEADLATPEEQPVSPPIWLTSDYLYDSLDHYADVINERRQGYVYGRYGNPTHTALHQVLASLEGAEAAWSFGSGMAALHTTITSLVASGGRVVAQRTLYGGTFSLLTSLLPRYGIEHTFADPEADAVASAIRDDTGLVLIETLANPTFRVADVRGIAARCADAGIPLVVDNTIPSPWLLRPLEIEGVTLVVHSTSKYIGGHSDLIGGAVAGPGEIVDPIRHLALQQGTTAASFEAWLALRGVQTLALRMTHQSQTALEIAEAIAKHPKVGQVGYAGLPGHLEHRRAGDLFGWRGFGAMLSFELESYDACARFADALSIIRVGSSFGGMRSEICHPATTSHRQLGPDDRSAADIGDGLLRLAVGGEDAADLVADLEGALEKA
ncbi:MAG: PLP-dependent aspartate aminotransferase family protein [Actinomycetota bacterium]